MAREAWTDERLDDLKDHIDEGFREVRAELRQQREETAQMARQKDMDARFADVNARFEAHERHMDARFDDLNRTMQIGFGLIGAVLVALLGLMGAQL